jgi:predicted RNA-binding protein with PIN domain
MRATHLVIDGMNLIGTRPNEWWRDRKRAMRELVGELERYAEATDDAVTVVFDTDPAISGRHGVSVIAATRRGRDAADDEIERMVSEEADPGRLTVVTSDARLAASVRARGAQVASSGAFRRRLDQVGSA